MSDDLALLDQKSTWIKRNLGCDVARAADALGIDLPDGQRVEDKATFAASVVPGLRRDAQALATTLGKALPADVPGRTELATAIGDVLKQLDGEAPPVAKLRVAIDGLGKRVPAMVDAIAQAVRVERRRVLVTAADALVTALPDLGASTAELGKPLVDAAKAVGEAMPEAALTDDALTAGQGKLDAAKLLAPTVETALREAKTAYEALGKRADAVRDRLKALPDGVGEVGTAKTALEKAETALASKLAWTAPNLKTFGTALDDAEGAATTAEQVVKALGERKSKLEAALKAAVTPEDVLDDAVAGLDVLRKTAATALAALLSSGGLDTAEKAIKGLTDAIASAQTEAAELGGKAGMAALLQAFGDAKALDAAFGDRKALRALTAAMGAAELAGLAGALGGGNAGKGAATVAGLAGEFGAKALPDLAKQVGADKLAALAAQPAGAKGVKALCDGFTPVLLGALMTGPGDAARPQQLFDGVKDKAALKRLVAGGGFDGKPAAFAALVTTGCDGDPTKFGTLCAGLSGKTDLPRLQALVTSSGLGDAPDAFGQLVKLNGAADPAKMKQLLEGLDSDGARTGLKRALTKGGLAGKPAAGGAGAIDPACLGQLLAKGQPPTTPAPDLKARCASLTTLLAGLDDAACGKLAGVLSESGLGAKPEGFASLVGVGCEGKPADLKALLSAFDEAPKRAALKRGVETGGLAGRPAAGGDPAIDPSCLAHILKSGHKEPAPTTAAGRSAGLATLLSGLDGAACGNLGDLLAKGGLGQAPDRLGPLVGLGCDGDGAKVAALANGMTAPDSRAGLKKLLESGGFGAKKAGTTVDTGVSPDCLGRLYGAGCEGKPAELDKLVKALTDADRVALQNVMADGELGKHPKVLGKLYKFGCLEDPFGADNGTKKPKVLTDMVGAFNVPGGGALFKDMLGAGKLDTASGENRLGSLVRYGFTPKDGSPQPMVQSATKLKQLATSFAGAGNMAKLGTTVDAICAAPDTILLANTAAAPANQPGRGLRNVINAPGFGGNPGALRTKFYETLDTRSADPNAGHPARLTRTALLQNAASLEHASVNAGATETIGGYKTRTGHIKVRHTRKYSNATPTMSGGHGNKTTLYPRRADPDADVTARVGTALANLGTSKPRDAADIDYDTYGGDFEQFTGVPDGQGCPSLVGFAADGANAAVTQFAPTAGTTINYDDMDAIRRALR